MSGTLFVVATPLGNLEDLSPRAVRTLQSVDLIACEDTRHSRKLLTHFGIRTPTTSCHEHNEAAKSSGLVARLQGGADVALLSDAGTPTLSDPGHRLVKSCREAGVSVVPIPGPSALAAALSASGLPADRFTFMGFLPRKKSQRKKALDDVSGDPKTLVFYLSPHGLDTVLEQILRVLGDRPGGLFREMTKLHETHYTGTVAEILEKVREEPSRGEYTLVVGGAPAPEPAPLPIDAAAYVAGLVELRGLTRREALRQAALELGTSRRELYARVTGQE